MHRKWETLCNIWCCSFLHQWQYSVINFVKIPLTFLCDHFTLDNQRKFMSCSSKYCFFLFQIYPFTTQFFPPYLHVPCFLVPLCFCNHQVFYSLSKSLTLHKHSENYNVALDIEIEKRMAKKLIKRFSKRLTKRLTRVQIKSFQRKWLLNWRKKVYTNKLFKRLKISTKTDSKKANLFLGKEVCNRGGERGWQRLKQWTSKCFLLETSFTRRYKKKR